jgi:signal transduction histidine kinase
VRGARAVLVCLHVGVHSVSLSVYHEGADDRAVVTPSDHLSGLRLVAARVEHMGGVFVTRGSAEAGHLVGALLPFGAE